MDVGNGQRLPLKAVAIVPTLKTLSNGQPEPLHAAARSEVTVEQPCFLADQDSDGLDDRDANRNGVNGETTDLAAGAAYPSSPMECTYTVHKLPGCSAPDPQERHSAAAHRIGCDRSRWPDAAWRCSASARKPVRRPSTTWRNFRRMTNVLSTAAIGLAGV